jgi:hypothetical protein
MYVHPVDVRRALEPKPEPAWVALAAAVLVAVALLAGCALARNPALAILVSPFLGGAVLGLLSLRHPYRSALLALLFLILALAVDLPDPGMTVGGLLSVAVVALPQLLAGAAYGNLVRRWARSRRTDRAAHQAGQ